MMVFKLKTIRLLDTIIMHCFYYYLLGLPENTSLYPEYIKKLIEDAARLNSQFSPKAIVEHPTPFLDNKVFQLIIDIYPFNKDLAVKYIFENPRLLRPICMTIRGIPQLPLMIQGSKFTDHPIILFTGRTDERFYISAKQSSLILPKLQDPESALPWKELSDLVKAKLITISGNAKIKFFDNPQDFEYKQKELGERFLGQADDISTKGQANLFFNWCKRNLSDSLLTSVADALEKYESEQRLSLVIAYQLRNFLQKKQVLNLTLKQFFDEKPIPFTQITMNKYINNWDKFIKRKIILMQVNLNEDSNLDKCNGVAFSTFTEDAINNVIDLANVLEKKLNRKIPIYFYDYAKGDYEFFSVEELKEITVEHSHVATQVAITQAPSASESIQDDLSSGLRQNDPATASAVLPSAPAPVPISAPNPRGLVGEKRRHIPSDSKPTSDEESQTRKGKCEKQDVPSGNSHGKQMAIAGLLKRPRPEKSAQPGITDMASVSTADDTLRPTK